MPIAQFGRLGLLGLLLWYFRPTGLMPQTPAERLMWAIWIGFSGDVIVGGQGFNDCLFWNQSDQLKDSVNITLLDARNNGAAYLDLNGYSETAASLTMTIHNKIKTDAPEGRSGMLTVKLLTIGGVKKAAGVYSAATESWIEGKGKVVVRP